MMVTRSGYVLRVDPPSAAFPNQAKVPFQHHPLNSHLVLTLVDVAHVSFRGHASAVPLPGPSRAQSWVAARAAPFPSSGFAPLPVTAYSVAPTGLENSSTTLLPHGFTPQLLVADAAGRQVVALTTNSSDWALSVVYQDVFSLDHVLDTSSSAPTPAYEAAAASFGTAAFFTHSAKLDAFFLVDRVNGDSRAVLRMLSASSRRELASVTLPMKVLRESSVATAVDVSPDGTLVLVGGLFQLAVVRVSTPAAGALLPAGAGWALTVQSAIPWGLEPAGVTFLDDATAIVMGEDQWVLPQVLFLANGTMTTAAVPPSTCCVYSGAFGVTPFAVYAATAGVSSASITRFNVSGSDVVLAKPYPLQTSMFAFLRDPHTPPSAPPTHVLFSDGTVRTVVPKPTAAAPDLTQVGKLSIAASTRVTHAAQSPAHTMLAVVVSGAAQVFEYPSLRLLSTVDLPRIPAAGALQDANPVSVWWGSSGTLHVLLQYNSLRSFSLSPRYHWAVHTVTPFAGAV